MKRISCNYKKLLSSVILLLMFTLAGTVALAATGTVVGDVPDQYGLIVEKKVEGAENNGPFDVTVKAEGEDTSFEIKDGEGKYIYFDNWTGSVTVKEDKDSESAKLPGYDLEIKYETNGEETDRANVTNGSAEKVTITNIYRPCVDLTIKKKIEGVTSDSKEFPVRLRLTSGNEENVICKDETGKEISLRDLDLTISVNDPTSCRIVFKAAGTYSFEISEGALDRDDPDVSDYENDSTIYKMTVEVMEETEGSGKLKIADGSPSFDPNISNNEITFTNKYICTYTPEVEKVLKDENNKTMEDWEGSKFTFRMEPANVKLPSEMFYVEDKPNETGRDIELEYTVDEPGRQSFDKAIIFPKDTVEGDYIFWLWETDENRTEGIRYDDAAYQLTVTVERESGGKLTAKLASWQKGTLDENHTAFEATGDEIKPGDLFAEENRVKFTNQYTDDVPCTYTPQVEKILLAPDGETELNDSTEEFSFTLTYDGDSKKVTLGETTATASAAKPGKFGAITFEEDGTYEFTIREEKKAGYLCDEAEIKLTVTVKDLKVTKAEYTGAKKDAAVFTNTQTEEKTGSLIIKKVVSGGPESAGDKTFTFTVTGPDNYTETVTLKAGEIETLSGLPLGTYTVTESGAELGGYTLTVDGTGPVEVTAGEPAEVTVTNTYTPEKPEEPTEPETPDDEPERPQLPDPNDPDSPETVTIMEDDVPTTYVKVWDPETEEFLYIPEDEVPLFGFETPETGDNSQTVLLGGVCALALAGIVVLTVTKRRNKKEQ